MAYSVCSERRCSGSSSVGSLLVICLMVLFVGIFYSLTISRDGGEGAAAAGVDIRTIALSPTPAATVRLALDSSWRTDPVWYDGKAEYAVYDAIRPIYGKDRHYEAVLITNKQQMDPKTTTKSADWKAPGQVEVFKHNLREVIPTENYVYKYLTTAFVRTDNLSPFKMTMSSQEDCGATFKHFVADGSRVRVDSFVYFPDGGPKHVEYVQPIGMQFQDDLSLVLRGYPFDHPSEEPMSLPIVSDQTLTHATPYSPITSTVIFKGKETLDLPIGQVEAYRIEVVIGSGDETEVPGGSVASYWFAADGGPDWLHAMVKYDGPFGVKYELKSKKRWAYWIRK